MGEIERIVDKPLVEEAEPAFSAQKRGILKQRVVIAIAGLREINSLIYICVILLHGHDMHLERADI
jgi:hypothetical protein